MASNDRYRENYGILNVSLSDDNWHDITFPTSGVKYYAIQDKEFTHAIDFRKSAQASNEWRINVGCIKEIFCDLGAGTAGGQVKRVGSDTVTVQVYYEY